MESEEDSAMLHTIKDPRLNVVALLLESLHALHQGVSDELKIREQHALTIVSEFKVNNEKLFTKKTQALKEQEEL